LSAIERSGRLRELTGDNARYPHDREHRLKPGAPMTLGLRW
jgi:hypothetical protein